MDKKNLQLFMRLSKVKPLVPVVVKRNYSQKRDETLQTIPDAEEPVDLNGVNQPEESETVKQASAFDQRSLSMPNTNLRKSPISVDNKDDS